MFYDKKFYFFCENFNIQGKAGCQVDKETEHELMRYIAKNEYDWRQKNIYETWQRSLKKRRTTLKPNTSFENLEGNKIYHLDLTPLLALCWLGQLFTTRHIVHFFAESINTH